MKNLTKKIAGLLAGVILAVTLTPAAYAQEGSSAEESVQALVAERCELAQERVTTRLENYTSKKEQFTANYDEAKATLSEVVQYLEGEGYDVASLKSAQTELESKIDNFIEQYAILIERLEEVDSLSSTCGDGTGTYLDAYNEARKQGINVREAVRDIRQYYRSNVRAEINDIRRLTVMDQE